MPSLSIIIPALNEERKLALTVNEMLALSRAILDQFEIIVVDDGSSDRTGQIADEIAAGQPEISVVHNGQCRGLGFVFSDCITRARHDYFMLIPGDHAYNTEGLGPIFQALGKADLLVGIRTNQARARSWLRVCLSRLYNAVMATLFGFRLSDFHGPVIFPLRSLRNINLRVIGYTFQIEALIRLLRRKHTFLEVPVKLNQEDTGSSRSLRFKTLGDLIRIVYDLLRHR